MFLTTITGDKAHPIQEATLFATQAHLGTFRKNLKVPYIVHPLEVMKQLAAWGIRDDVILQAAVLHDVVEDTNITLQEIENLFGAGVAHLVKELTFTGDKQERQAYLDSFGTKTWGSHVIKVADRLCNVRDFALTDYKYSLKYLKQADKLFKDFFNRKDVSDELKSSVAFEHVVLTGDYS